MSEDQKNSDDAARTLLGRTVDRKYHLDVLLGSGGMGSVYKATRLLIGDTVAVKILHSDQLKDPQAIERFRREAQAAARLKHPNVVTIHDFGITESGLAYLVMELVEGDSLRDLIRRKGSFHAPDAAGIIAQVASALDEAHRHDIVHRDLKPDNIVVTTLPNGIHVKVLDFGVARMRDVSAGIGTLTNTGMIVGTPYYMSPEQCMGEQLDGRSDIYSLGVMLYEMLAGTVPFNAPSLTAVVMQHVTKPPPPLHTINPAITQAVEAVVMHALQKQREMRPPTATDLARELDSAISGGVNAQATVVGPGIVNAAPSIPTSPGAAPKLQQETQAYSSQSTERGSRAVTAVAPEFHAPQSGVVKKRTAVVIGVAVLLFIAAAGVTAGLLLSRQGAGQADNQDNSNAAQRQSNNPPPVEQSNTKSESKLPVPDLAAAPIPPPVKEADTRVDAKPAEAYPTPAPARAEGEWFVIVSSFPKTNRPKADEQLRYIQGLGYEAKIIDTDAYPNLQDGFWSVVVGPYTRASAKEVANKMRAVAKDVYIKSGW
jgi:serine/threonine protein kinase